LIDRIAAQILVMEHSWGCRTFVAPTGSWRPLPMVLVESVLCRRHMQSTAGIRPPSARAGSSWRILRRSRPAAETWGCGGSIWHGRPRALSNPWAS
jgi:hypothetical protein